MEKKITDEKINQIYEEMIDTMIDNFIDPDVELSSPLRYYGGKYYIADKIIELFPKHECYVEPFFGAGHVFFRKKPSPVEIINDIDGNLVNFFKVLQNEQNCKKLLKMIITTPVSRAIYDELKPKIFNNQFTDDVERAFVFFYFITNSFNGKIKGGFSYSSTCNFANRYLNKINKLIFVHKRLISATIENLDAVEIIKRYDTKNTLFYLDPPYVHSTRTTNKDYLYEMSNEKHMELIDVVLSSEGMFVISNYDNEIYQRLEKYGYKKIAIDVIAPATYKPEERFNHKKSARKEIIWYNTNPNNTVLSLF